MGLRRRVLSIKLERGKDRFLKVGIEGVLCMLYDTRKMAFCLEKEFWLVHELLLMGPVEVELDIRLQTQPFIFLPQCTRLTSSITSIYKTC